MLAPERVSTVEVLGGRYALYDELASGGMASVHFARILGAAGFHRVVAIKRLHKPFARDPEFVSGFIDEARLAARIRHPNVIQTLDVVLEDGELFLVMEYVPGESVSALRRACDRTQTQFSVPIASAILIDALEGLHAAHEARSEAGEPLSIVHRDVSPQNILVGTDGVARVLDFGIAKASSRLQVTREGHVKGKLAYMAPEQLRDQKVTRQSDVYAAGVVLWELLTGRRLFSGQTDAAILTKILDGAIVPPSVFAADLDPELDAAVLSALSRDPEERPPSARELANVLRRVGSPAAPNEIAVWLEQISSPILSERAARVRAIELDCTDTTAVRSSEPPRPHAARRRWLEGLAVALGGAVVVSVTYAASSRSSAEVAAPETSAPLAAATPVRSAAPKPEPASSAAPAERAAPGEHETRPPASSPRSPARATRPASKSPAVASAAASAPASVDCKELMYRDAAGIWRLKKQCL